MDMLALNCTVVPQPYIFLGSRARKLRVGACSCNASCDVTLVFSKHLTQDLDVRFEGFWQQRPKGE
eukprot:CAMPEP_0172864970 /NCGR_PEP_ID=MMETSP1075-20121228/81139_1 /TAXON_ID=2916 /ORGANISM="Ceratium fusus, Strain PA161109" /LENGTH=65 /DNA_ID=CAMNT_0013713949 /DNA_START=35 /DNA_END=229 /DNA_ORIENTATION=+